MIVDIETSSLLLYTLANEQFALPMSEVREVIRWRMPTPIPGTPSMVLGVIHHRGMVLPVLDLRVLLGLAQSAPTRSTRLLVVEQSGIQAGLVADSVVDIVEVESSVIEPAPASISAAHAQFLGGLFFSAGQPVALMTLSAVFAAVTSAHAVG